jgi:type I site-specific restriction endonuclease
VTVLDREVGSMTEFKQIVGRGRRVHEESRPLRRHCEGPFVSVAA